MPYTTECDSCGQCCKNWRITLDVEDIKKIEKLGYNPDDFVIFQRGIPEFKKKKNRSCIFLDEKNLCEIHKKHGFNAKAKVCKEFPGEEMLCGKLVFNKKGNNAKKKKVRNDFFLRVGNKHIHYKSFFKMLKNVPDFKSYMNLLKNIDETEKNVIMNPLKVKNYNPDTSKVEKYLKKMMLCEGSTNLFPFMSNYFNKKIDVLVPIKNNKISISFGEVNIDGRVMKEFQKYLNTSAKQYFAYNNFPEIWAFFLYYVPIYSKAIAGDEKIELRHMIEAFSILNRYNRFLGFANFREYNPGKMNLTKKITKPCGVLYRTPKGAVCL